ncbi:mitochondrial import inner membrane translocase subunit Tim10B [Teleopsis dalmanni]|uniref:mitochondrial import inner membrane translocase subunit Tim10B n=1 Tax=Teleopsis dalmanni TaxID=139649 RepID=UPI0018CE3600|nr:mitochondrial import inner membrane translocase subunit Tim10B [Teleopsis dalmanni]
MDPNLRNLKDFLGLYNKVTELCFTRCVDNLSDRNLSTNEHTCVDSCVTKFARFNQKMMNVYIEVQTEINQRRIRELEESQNGLQREVGSQEPQGTAEPVPKKKPKVIPGLDDKKPAGSAWL